jgi:hypothetical protein
MLLLIVASPRGRVRELCPSPHYQTASHLYQCKQTFLIHMFILSEEMLGAVLFVRGCDCSVCFLHLSGYLKCRSAKDMTGWPDALSIMVVALLRVKISNLAAFSFISCLLESVNELESYDSSLRVKVVVQCSWNSSDDFWIVYSKHEFLVHIIGNIFSVSRLTRRFLSHGTVFIIHIIYIISPNVTCYWEVLFWQSSIVWSV